MRTFIIHQNRFRGTLASFFFLAPLYFSADRCENKGYAQMCSRTIYTIQLLTLISRNVSNESVEHEHEHPRQTLRIMLFPPFALFIYFLFVSSANSLSLIMHRLKASMKFYDIATVFNANANENEKKN